jgi:hypothetical protein
MPGHHHYAGSPKVKVNSTSDDAAWLRGAPENGWPQQVRAG